MWGEVYGDPALEELAAARDSDELCRLLVQSPWRWGSSTRHQEAVSLLRGLDGGTLPSSLVALLLCTCHRWDRVTAKLIAAIEECGVLSIARVRRAALDRLCELDGPGAALRRAQSDADRTVRAWRPPGTPTPAQQRAERLAGS
jgi:hypothetical protein